MVSAWQQAQQDANEMSDSSKRRMAGICCYNLLGLVATAAFCCAITSYAYCDFATRKVSVDLGIMYVFLSLKQHIYPTHIICRHRHYDSQIEGRFYA